MRFARFVRFLLGRGRQRRFYVEPPIRQAKKLFQKHPIFMNAICYGSLCAGAELSQQTIRHHFNNSCAATAMHSNSSNSVRYDFGPVKRLAVWGTLVLPPLYHKWYRWLDKRFPVVKNVDMARVAKKTLLDQFVFTPPILVLFFAAMALAEALAEHGRHEVSFGPIRAEVANKFAPVFLADCAFWIPAQTFNFVFVPPTWRVAYIGAMTFVWLNMLCFAKSCKLAW